MKVEILKALDDNYIFLIVWDNGTATVVDPGDPSVVLSFLKKYDLRLTHILCTHHHWDHIGGIDNIINAIPDVKVIGYLGEELRIPHLNLGLEDGDSICINGDRFLVIFVPGHTIGSIAFYNKEHNIVFVGDTLFFMGCGRLFEGTYEMLYNSLQRLSSLPKCTKVYCGHEYTKSNLSFAKYIEPSNKDLDRMENLLNNLNITIPSTIEQEHLCNPFLRVSNKSIRTSIGCLDSQDDLYVFTKLRQLKDRF